MKNSLALSKNLWKKMRMAQITVVWFRTDLRLHDNPALDFAKQQGEVLPVYIWSPKEEGGWAPGEGAKKWLLGSLKSLEKDLKKRGMPLLFEKGEFAKTLASIVDACGAANVVWNRRYEPYFRTIDAQIEKQLVQKGVQVKTFNASLLVEPWEILTKEGKPYQVFTPFYKTVLKHPISPPTSEWPLSHEKNPLDQPGEGNAHAHLELFIKKGGYAGGTSHLSPYLHLGEIGPRQIWHKVSPDRKHEDFLRELIWREFAYHLLYHFPETPTAPLRKEFKNFPWISDKNALKLWKEGKTGYPYVDAAMRELNYGGWISNRARLVVASFLTKDLLIPWQEGARWFWEKLIDADLANNTLGWQWTSGCGADAAPYFRIFNPIKQGQTHDPHGIYVRKWVPELQNLPNEWIHNPFDAPQEILEQAGIALGKTYPYPLIDHSVARERALKAFKKIKGEA